MPNIKFDDRTYLKNWKKEKNAWKKAARMDGAKDLSSWIRNVLNSFAK